MTAAMLRCGWHPVPSVHGYPNALTTGPAAGGYTDLTPVTLSSETSLNSSGYPDWATADEETGGLLVQGIEFTMAAQLDVYADIVSFVGCDFNSTQLATNNGPLLVTLRGTGPYVFDFCSLHGSDGTGATRVNEVLDMVADCNLTVQNTSIYYMRQALNIANGTVAGVTVTGCYLHGVVLFTQAPAAPEVSNAAGGGTVAAGTYQAQVTYVGPPGESIASASTSTTLSAEGTITIDSPASSSDVGGATGWYCYILSPGGSSYYRQQASGSPTAIGTNLTLTAPPATSGTTAPDGDHSECIYAGANGSGSNIAITGNTIYNQVDQTACVYLHPTQTFSDVTISGNLLAGGGYCLYCGDDSSTDVVIEDNVVSTLYYAGGGAAANPAVGYPTSPPRFNVSGGNVWSGNTWYDGESAGETIAAP
jgi:hypothetical protein